MNLKEKIEVARCLERLKVDVIEAGFAIASPGDFESVQTIARTVKDCSVASLARATVKDIDCAWEAVKDAADPRIHLFIATSPLHMEYKLKMTPEQVLERTAAMVAHAKKYTSNIEFSCEDATRSDVDFLIKVVDLAIKNGATVVNIPDTTGYTTPDEMRAMIEAIRYGVPDSDKVEFSVHCHNDLGMATANALAGVLGGARQIECTINGLGERAGNTSLEEVVMAMHTRPDIFTEHDCRIDTTQIFRASKTVYNIIGQSAPLNKPIVGVNAFRHESGIHQHGVLANKKTYEILTPESVGVVIDNIVLGKHSGKHALSARLKEMGYDLDEAELQRCFEEFKDLCDKIIDLWYTIPNRPKGRGVQISVSLSTFIPKPFTPFEFEPQPTEDEIDKKQKYLLDIINSKKVNISWSRYPITILEAVLARGDRKLCDVIYTAWKKGCKLDGWSEYYRYDLWKEAFKECGIDMSFYANRKREYDEIMPWSHMDILVSRDFFIRENKKAHEETPTPNCREKCSGCGVNKCIGGKCFE